MISETKQSTDQVTVTVCVGKDLTVSKTAAGTFDRTYKWLIDKSVDDTRIEIAEGGTATFNYLVKVTPNGYTDSNWTLAGKITVTNPNDWEAITADVTDVYNGGVCTVSGGTAVVVPAGKSVLLDYSCAFASQPLYKGINTATATWDKAAYFTPTGTASGTADVTIGLKGETNRTVTVIDDKTNPASPVTLGTSDYYTGPFEYKYALQKQGVAGTCTNYTNTAVIDETRQSDFQTVTVCVGKDLTVTKTAAGSFNRTYLWKISKDVDKTLVKIAEGGSYTFNYTVGVEQTGISDAGWTLSGKITITNPNDWEDITLTGLTDLVDNGGTCTVAAGPYTVAAGKTLEVNYTCAYASAPSSYSGKNTATATWNKAAAFTPNGTASGSAGLHPDPARLDQQDRPCYRLVCRTTRHGDSHRRSSVCHGLLHLHSHRKRCGRRLHQVRQHGHNRRDQTDRRQVCHRLCRQGPDDLQDRLRHLRPHLSVEDLQGCRQDLCQDRLWRQGHLQLHRRRRTDRIHRLRLEIERCDHIDQPQQLGRHYPDITCRCRGQWRYLYGCRRALQSAGRQDALMLPYSCTYSSASSLSGKNKATATWDNATYFTPTGTASAEKEFTLSQAGATNKTIHVTDTFGGTLGTLTATDAAPFTKGTFTYSHDFAGVGGKCTSYDNIATITETGQSDKETVTVCVGKDLTVSKTTVAKYDRLYKWLIDKSVDKTRIYIFYGGTATFNYTVKVTPNGFTDSNWTLYGKITVTNPNDWEDITADVTDVYDGGGLCTVTGGTGVVIPAGKSVILDYSCVFASQPAYSGKNTATATWDKAAYFTPTGTASGITGVAFARASRPTRSSPWWTTRPILPAR